MAVYPLGKEEKIALDFVLERIYLRQDGSVNITVDLLVKNLSPTPISRLRIALPYPLINLNEIKEKNLKKIQHRFRDFRKNQLKCIHISSNNLRTPEHPSNWIYRTLPHIALFDDGGKVTVRRRYQKFGPELLPAPVKRSWTVDTPPESEVDDWMWFLLSVNNMNLVDLLAPPVGEPQHGRPDERLVGNESMWLRVGLDLPAEGVNKHSLLSQYVSPSLEYFLRFSSPEVITEEIKTKIRSYPVVELGPDGSAPVADKETLISMAKAQEASEAQLPHQHMPVEVKDWRIFLYREYGLNVEKVDLGIPPPCEPKTKTGPSFLPIEAFPAPSELGWAPGMLYRLFKRKRARIMDCNEYWIGSDHEECNSGGYSICLTARTFNDLGLKVALLALVLEIVHILAEHFGLLN